LDVLYSGLTAREKAAHSVSPAGPVPITLAWVCMMRLLQSFPFQAHPSLLCRRTAQKSSGGGARPGLRGLFVAQSAPNCIQSVAAILKVADSLIFWIPKSLEK
jgi:hypothetical protein